jgi:hypothetical protein
MIILPKYFESMFGDADQLIHMKLRLRDEPDHPVRACRHHARHDTSWHQHDMPNSSFHTRTHEHTNTIMISRHEFLSMTMQCING